jgi:hypothetical protein
MNKIDLQISLTDICTPNTMTNANTLNMLALMSVISQLDARSELDNAVPMSSKSLNYKCHDKRVKLFKVVPKVIGTPRRFGNLSGNARTNMRI